MSKKRNKKIQNLNLYGAPKNVTIDKTNGNNELEIGLNIKNVIYDPQQTITNIQRDYENKNIENNTIEEILNDKITINESFPDLSQIDDNNEAIQMYKWSLEGDDIGFPYYEAFTYNLADNMFIIEFDNLNINVSDTPETFIPIFLKEIEDENIGG